MSGQKVNKTIENEIKHMLNALINNPDQIQQSANPTSHQEKIAKLKADLEILLNSQPIDEDSAQQLILLIAAAQYEIIPFTEYEIQRLRYIFIQADPMDELDAGLLKNTVHKTGIKNNGNVSIFILRLFGP